MFDASNRNGGLTRRHSNLECFLGGCQTGPSDFNCVTGKNRTVRGGPYPTESFPRRAVYEKLAVADPHRSAGDDVVPRGVYAHEPDPDGRLSAPPGRAAGGVRRSRLRRPAV